MVTTDNDSNEEDKARDKGAAQVRNGTHETKDSHDSQKAAEKAAGEDETYGNEPDEG